MNDLAFALFIVAVGVGNVVLGNRWSRLDHNPWANRPFGGLLSGPKPGIMASDLNVSELNARGRKMMMISPVATVMVLLFFLHTRHYF